MGALNLGHLTRTCLNDALTSPVVCTLTVYPAGSVNTDGSLIGSPTASTVYSDQDGDSVQANPSDSDSAGFFSCFLQPGIYDIRYTGALITAKGEQNVMVVGAVNAAGQTNLSAVAASAGRETYLHTPIRYVGLDSLTSGVGGVMEASSVLWHCWNCYYLTATPPANGWYRWDDSKPALRLIMEEPTGVAAGVRIDYAAAGAGEIASWTTLFTVGLGGQVTAPILLSPRTLGEEDSGTSRVLTSADYGKTLFFTSNAEVTVTLPAAGAPIGSWIRLIATGDLTNKFIVNAPVADTLYTSKNKQADGVEFAAGERTDGTLFCIAGSDFWHVSNQSAGNVMTVVDV
jgi:hypothetical protein